MGGYLHAILLGAVKEVPFSTIFAPELYSRLLWFVRLRWLAAIGLVLASLLGGRVGFPDAWPNLFLVAAFILVYNLIFSTQLRRRGAGEYTNLRWWAIAQMAMDLAALTVTVHFTGGMHSPALPFFAFHMAIGTIMIRTRIMFLVATGTCLVITCQYLLWRSGVVVPDAIEASSVHITPLMLVVLVFGMVYVTDSVTSRFKDHSIELNRTSEALRERSAELQGLLEVKEDLEKQKSHYLRISAHQLRSPLGTIKTSLQVILDGYLDPSSERGRRLLEGTADRVVDLLAIVNDLLELAKMREGRAKAPWTRQVYLNQVLADIFDALEPFASQRQVKMVPEMVGVAVLTWGVPPDLVYAFENLVHNAIKYSNPGGEVSVQLRVKDGIATVKVRDQGIGIPRTLLSDVFLEFVRAPNAKRFTSEGTGLGLSIVRQAIRGHGGEVTVESSEGAGTQFCVTMPLDYVPEEMATAQGEARR